MKTMNLTLSSTRVLGAALLALGMGIPGSWAQNQNSSSPRAPRDSRNEPNQVDNDQWYDLYDQQADQYDGSYENRNYDQDSYQSDSRDYSQGNQNQYSQGNQDQYDNRGQRGQNDQQGAQRDRPAGLGVMLDASQGNVEVRRVARNSPADRAGMQIGDEIVAINGQRVESTQQVAQLVRREDPGSQIDIRIRRDGNQRTLTAQLESLQQALDNLNRARQQQGQQGNASYENSPPWGDDQLMQHVDELEQQVRRMQDEINDLRSMLSSNPSERFSQRGRRNQ